MRARVPGTRLEPVERWGDILVVLDNPAEEFDHIRGGTVQSGGTKVEIISWESI